ncbi:homeobox protein BEL1 homolog [Silene latifolia]|uniref:homeobox protein BEL1 homolog n=1 Tax=Silene latifolia TaxID=37657 RepID=UPI003D789586
MDHHHLLEEKSPRQNNNNNNNNNGIMASSSSSTFCYPNVTPSNYDPNPEMFHLTSGLEMIGFQPKPLNNNDPNDQSKGSEFFHDDHENRGVGRNNLEDHHHHHQVQVGAFMNEFSIRSCVFPCEGNERPSQGLSLSLSSSNPSSIGVQSFELRTNHNHNHNQLLNHLSNHQRFNSRDGFLGKSQSFQQQQQQEFFLGKSGGNSNNSSGNSNNSSMSLQQFEFVRNSKYMGPVQELLNEFCCLGTQQKQSLMMMKNKKKKKNKDDNLDLLHDDEINDDVNNASSSSSSRNIYSSSSSLYGLCMLDLQKRKTKLFGMLEELDRRYKHYCDQLKAIELSFESVAGHGTANVYTTLASKAMSKHFRCLRDSLVAQIKATKKAMGEKDGASSIVPGTTKGETPRLRILDQTLRQQRAFQQMTLMETHPWRPQRGLPERSVSVLRAWLFEHFLHPYPSDVDKHILARQTNLSRSQVSNWFINARVRLWKPMVEQMYLEETKEQQDKNMGSSSDATDHHLPNDHDGLIQDQKPDPNDLIRLDPDSLTSIVNTTQNDNNSPHNAPTATNLQQNQQFGRDEAFAYVALPDFPSSSSYTHNHASTAYGTTQNDNNAPHQGFGGGGTSGGNNVSLTLGLQQHGGNGVSLAFSPVSQGSLFYGRDHIDDCQQVHGYSLLEGDQGQNLPYRNLMDAQLLHDFTQ